MIDLIQYKQEVYEIIGCAMRVHSELGNGLLEPVYQEAMTIELSEKGIEWETEKEINIYYKNHILHKKYRMDLMIGDIICELKYVNELCAEHRAQLCNYLRLTHKPIGLLINFGEECLKGERWAYDVDTNECYIIDKDMTKINYQNIY